MLWELVRKDLKLFAADRKGIIITVLVPIALASFMALVFGGGGGNGGPADAIAVALVDEDDSGLSRAVADDLSKGGALAVRPTSAGEAAEAVRAGRQGTALVLPAGFGRQAGLALFGGGEPPRVRLLYDPSKAMEAQVVRGALMQSAMGAVSRESFAGPGRQETLHAGLSRIDAAADLPGEEKAALRDLFASLDRYYGQTSAASRPQTGPVPAAAAATPARGGLQAPFALVEEPVAAGSADAGRRRATVVHAFVGMTVQGVLFFAIEAAMGLLRDRNRGIWRRLRAAPLARATLLGGKALSTAAISVGVMAAVLLFGAAAFGLRVDGSPVGFLLVCLSTAAMIATLGLLIATVGRTEAQSKGLSVLAVLVMSMLGGAWIPTFMMPAAIRPVSAALPSRWAVEGLDAMTWRGGGLADAMGPSAALLGFSVLFAVVSVAWFRWEAD